MDGGAAHPLVGVMRRFCVDWLCRADETVPGEILDPHYVVRIGEHTLTGRDAQYVPGTLGQLRRFPGLLITVHELFTDGERVAMRFTEHGPSASDGGRPAAWAGIGLFWWDGERLTRNVTEEDYHSRRRQLADDRCDPVEGPAPAPWAARPIAPDADAEAAARAWLATGDLTAGGAVGLDDGWAGHPTPALLDVTDVRVEELFSAGRAVAFKVVQTGRYVGGLPDTEPARERAVELSAAGLVTVAPEGRIVGRVVRDRIGLRRAVRHG